MNLKNCPKTWTKRQFLEWFKELTRFPNGYCSRSTLQGATWLALGTPLCCSRQWCKTWSFQTRALPQFFPKIGRKFVNSLICLTIFSVSQSCFCSGHSYMLSCWQSLVFPSLVSVPVIHICCHVGNLSGFPVLFLFRSFIYVVMLAIFRVSQSCFCSGHSYMLSCWQSLGFPSLVSVPVIHICCHVGNLWGFPVLFLFRSFIYVVMLAIFRVSQSCFCSGHSYMLSCWQSLGFPSLVSVPVIHICCHVGNL